MEVPPRFLTTSKGVKTKVPVIIGCNVFKHAARKFIQDYGETALELFECPKEIDPLFFSCVELYYFSERNRRVTELTQKRERPMAKVGWGQLTWRAPKSEMRMPLGLVKHREKAGQNENPISRIKKNEDVTVET